MESPLFENSLNLSYTQFLIFEITNQCTLAKAHAKICPIGLPGRYGKLDTSRPLTDDLILECARIAYLELGFRGLVGWHYYCEPMIEWERIKKLAGRIKKEIPKAEFILWTNGTIMPENISELSLFSQIYLTNYFKKNWKFLKQELPNTQVKILSGEMDERSLGRKKFSRNRCLRPFNEMIVDYYGNGHICCIDFRGQHKLGNIWTDGFRKVANNFLETQELLSQQPIGSLSPNKDLPEICLYCATGRMYNTGRLVEPIADDAENYVESKYPLGIKRKMTLGTGYFIGKVELFIKKRISSLCRFFS